MRIRTLEKIKYATVTQLVDAEAVRANQRVTASVYVESEANEVATDS